ncbi:MAG: carboxypeptidase regulatory-like domain-containing protein [Acidobacteriota bacterium]
MNARRFLMVVVLAALGLFTFWPISPYVQAYDTTGTILGTVKDSTGAVIAGAIVIIRNLGTNFTREAIADEAGNFKAPLMPVGEYEITAEADNFSKAQSRVVLQINQVLRVDFQLSVAALKDDVVEVVGGTEVVVNRDSSTQSTVIDNKKIVDLPLNGRNFLQLGTLIPGTVGAAGGGSAEGETEAGAFSVSGQRDRAVNYYIDGADNNQIINNNTAAGASVDAIQEFTILTSTYSAEYGRNSGAVVNVVTKSGTNQFHGSLFEFLRNDRLDANGFFDNAANQRKAKFRNNQFGFTLGGPIVKDSTFFFINYEGQRTRVGNTIFTTVPTLLERQGIFTDPSSGRQVQVPIDPVSAGLLSFYPLPNTNTPFGNFVSSEIIKLRRDNALVKLDHRFGRNDLFSVRYLVNDRSSLTPVLSTSGTAQNSSQVAGFGLFVDALVQNLSVSEVHIFSQRTFNEFRFGYNRFVDVQLGLDATDPATLGLPNNNPSRLGKGIPQIIVSGISGIGNSNLFPFTDNLDTYQFIDNFTFNRGRHSFKTGLDIRRIQIDGLEDLSFAGTIMFDGSVSGISAVADLIQGTPQSAFIGRGFTAPPIRLSNYYFYFQDDYKVSDRLTVNAGIRYELNTVPTASGVLFNFTSGRGFFNKDLYRGDHNNFAPRVGFAYTPFNDGKTVLRGGFGIFYDLPFQNTTFNLTFNPPTTTTLFNFGPFDPGQLGSVFSNTNLDGGGPFLITIDPKFRNPYSYQFNFNIQRELPLGIALEAGYVGTRGVKLIGSRDINQAVFFPGASDDDNIFDRRPTQLAGLDFGVGGIDGIQQQESAGSSIYHSLQIKFTKRLQRGLSFLGAYTYSKSIDNATDIFGFKGSSAIPQDSNNLGSERAVSPFDLRQRFTFSYTYEFPFGKGQPFLSGLDGIAEKIVSGWQMNGIVTLQTGQPFTVFLGIDQALTGNIFNEQRPNNVPGAFIQKDNGQVVLAPQFLNSDGSPNMAALQNAGVIPAPGQFGSLGRNTFKGPRFRNFDFSLSKRTRITETSLLEFRAEFFNIFNHPTFALPDNNLSSPTFGQFSRTPDVANGIPRLSSGGPRVIQFGLKYIF